MRNFSRLISSSAYALRARSLRTRGIASKPRLITINLTDRCNCKCLMCGIHARGTADELSTGEIIKLLSSPALHDLDVIRLTGGEPFIREDLSVICKASSQTARAHITYLTTNGTLPSRIEEFIAGMPYPGLHLQVSIDALDERHDKFRGMPGALDSALKSLNMLAAARKKHSFHLGINQTIFAGTADQISPVAELAAKLNVAHNVILGAKFHEGKELAGISTEAPLPFVPQFEMTCEEIVKFYELAGEAKKKFGTSSKQATHSGMLRGLSEEYLNCGIRNRLLHSRNRPAPSCMAMFTHARITAAGDVVPCTVYADSSAGNVRHSDFDKVWSSSAADGLRKKVKACDGCWIECDISPSIFYSGDILKWAALRAFGRD